MERKSLLLLGCRLAVLLEMIYSIIVVPAQRCSTATVPRHGSDGRAPARRRDQRVDSVDQSARVRAHPASTSSSMRRRRRASLRDYPLRHPDRHAGVRVLIYYADGWTRPRPARA